MFLTVSPSVDHADWRILVASLNEKKRCLLDGKSHVRFRPFEVEYNTIQYNTIQYNTIQIKNEDKSYAYY